jgi:ADP-ribosylation factor-like protein 13B
LANKNDVDGAMDEIDVCNQLKVGELMEQEHFACQVEQCVALKQKSDRAIRRGMKWLLDNILKGYNDLSDRVNADVAVQREEEAKEKAERAERVRRLREERKKQEEAAGLKEDSEDEVDSGEIRNPFIPINEHIQSVEQRAREDKEKNQSVITETQEKQPKQSSSSSDQDDIVIGKPFPMPSPQHRTSASAPSLTDATVRKTDLDSLPSIEVKKPKKKKVRKNKVGVMPVHGSQSAVSINLPPIRGRVRPVAVWMRSDDGGAADMPPSEQQYLR